MPIHYTHAAAKQQPRLLGNNHQPLYEYWTHSQKHTTKFSTKVKIISATVKHQKWEIDENLQTCNKLKRLLLRCMVFVCLCNRIVDGLAMLMAVPPTPPPSIIIAMLMCWHCRGCGGSTVGVVTTMSTIEAYEPSLIIADNLRVFNKVPKCQNNGSSVQYGSNERQLEHRWQHFAYHM